MTLLNKKPGSFKIVNKAEAKVLPINRTPLPAKTKLLPTNFIPEPIPWAVTLALVAKNRRLDLLATEAALVNWLAVSLTLATVLFAKLLSPLIVNAKKPVTRLGLSIILSEKRLVVG